MKHGVRWILALTVAIACVPAADAGLLDAMRARRQQAAGEAESTDNAEERSGTKSKVVLPPGARAEQDLAYGDDPAQKLDVYIPQDAKNAPIIFMVHGGAWMVGDKGNSGVVANKVAHWLPKGYIVASPNYRMSRAPNPLDQADDLGRALAFVQSKASSWGGDSSRVLLMGHSAGAHLVALLTADPGIVAPRGVRLWLGTVALDSAALNVVDTMERKHARFYDMALGTDHSRWVAMSPFHRLIGKPQPILLVCSSRRSDSCPAARAYADKANSLGGRATVLPMDLNHGQINIELGRSPEYTKSIEDFMHSLGLP